MTQTDIVLPDPNTPPTCMYIGGCGRNGSTWLGMCLERSPDVCFAGELTHLWQRGFLDDELCDCGGRAAGRRRIATAATSEHGVSCGAMSRQGVPKIFVKKFSEFHAARLIN